jgi:DNA-binding transcriptional LysR family regulator
MRWRFERRGQVVMLDPPAVLISNNIGVIKTACINGIGVACLLEKQVAEELSSGALVTVLKEWSPTTPANYLYYPSRKQLSAALRAFIGAMRIESR